MPGAGSVGRANEQLSAESTIRLVREHPEAFDALGKPGSLVDVARDVLGLDEEDLEYYAAIPAAVQEAIRAAIFDALSERPGKPAKPVQLSYVPAVEFEAHVCDYGQAVTIQVRGPYEPASPGAAYAKRREYEAEGTASARRSKPRRGKATRAKRKPARRRGR